MELASAAPRRILVVDDMATNRKLLRVMLEHAGYAVQEATDGVRALAVLEREPMDAVISDILMPNMDGYRLCYELRRSERWRDLPFIFYSSTYRSVADEKLAQDIGGDLFVAKPATAEKILGALAGLIGSSRTAGRAELTVHGELGLMKRFSARLVAKLEEQNHELYHRTLDLEREVAQRALIEDSLRNSERLRRLIVETEPECVKVVGADGRLAEMNRAGLAMLEAGSLQDAQSVPLLDFIAPEHRTAFADLHRRVLRGESGILEFEAIGLAGTRRWLETHAVPLRDEAGGVTALLGVTRDVTERKRVDAALQRSESHFRELFDQAIEAIVVADTQGRCLDVNPAGCLMVGYTREELLAMSILDVIPPLESHRVATELARFAGGDVVSSEWKFRRKDGSIFQVEINGRRMSDGRLLAFVRDITERKQIELERQQSATRMQALARRLVDTREAEQHWLSAELHDRIGQTLTALGINLNIIAGVLPPGTSGTVTERLKDSRALVEATMVSVRDLISELRPAALDDYGLLAGLRWFGDQIRARTRLAMEVAGEEPVPRLAPEVEGALFRIAQEALNNTVKHAGARRASVELRCRPGACTLTIADDGVGFDPEQPAQPGARTHWGLEMMRERAEAVGARFRVTSASGQGARIEVEVERAP